MRAVVPDPVPVDGAHEGCSALHELLAEGKNVLPIPSPSEGSDATFLERLDEEITANAYGEVQRVYAETGS